MHWSAGLRATALCLVAAALSVHAAGPQSAGLHGTARAGAGPAPDAVVWLDAPNAPAAAARRIVLDQRNLNFTLHVLAVRVGTTVDFPNNDRVSAQVNVLHQSGLPNYGDTALDVGVTYSIRRGLRLH